MFRKVTLAACGLLLFIPAVASATNPERRQGTGFCCEWEMNVDWPHPFVCHDRIAVYNPINRMIKKGWNLQNTLSDYHFEEGTSKLNEAGRQKLLTILTAAPKKYRSIYVLRSEDPEQTAARIQTVQSIASALYPEGEAMVAETGTKPRTWPGDFHNLMTVRFRNTLPDPRIPSRDGGSGSGGGGGQQQQQQGP